MLKINENYINLQNNYLFAKITEEKNKYEKISNKKLIDLSIGDVTLPLVNSALDGIEKGKNLLSNVNTFKGYPPASGHQFLKQQIILNDYYTIKINVNENDIFICDSSKSDIANILDIFSGKMTVTIQDPVYPVYVDSNIIAGNNILYFNSIQELIFRLNEGTIQFDLLYLCSPNNPTGEVINKKDLETLVKLAKEKNYIIFFDAAYEAFIQDKNAIHSIYEIQDAKTVAIEFKSFSKTAGFTPLRLAYTVIPQDIQIDDISVNYLFKRLKDTKYNGPSFLSEYAMYNIYSTNSLSQLEKNIQYYLENTELLFNFFKSKGLIGNTLSTVNSPYVWIKTPDNMNSWDFFYFLLKNFGIVGTPGSGFGKNGETFFRFTGFGSRENICEAIKRLKKDF